jgi:hypothetical protein
VYRAGEDVHALSAAGAVGRIHGSGASPAHVLPAARPVIDALDAGIAMDHARGIIARLMRQALERDVIAGTDLDDGAQLPAEIPPMYGLVRGRHVPVPRLARCIRQALER